jgi:hypothetical protein
MGRTRPEVGRFLRLTHFWGEDLPAPVWAVIVQRFDTQLPVLDLDAEVFLGSEILGMRLGKAMRIVPVDEDDRFTVHTINSLPQHALVAWVKHQLTEGSA